MNRNYKWQDFPYKYDSFEFVFGYDYHIHKLVYDVKYYLNGDDWYLDPEGTTIL